MLKTLAKKMVSSEQWFFLSWYRRRFGFFSAISRFAHRLLYREEMLRVPKTGTEGCVSIRPGTADQHVYDEVFILKEYDINLGNPMFIVDAGAHIGLSSTFFADKYPSAIIAAIEPESSNFEMLLKNTASYPNIKPIKGGLWSRKAHLCIQESSVETWSFRVLEDPLGQGIPAFGIRDLLTDFGVKQIDVLKMDIEGAELEVLNHYNSWIDVVRILIIELHDRFQPGCTQALDKALSGYSYDRSRSGESIVITNLQRLSD